LNRPTAGFRKRWIRAKHGIVENLTAYRATRESIRVVYFCDDVGFALRTVLRDHLFLMYIRVYNSRNSLSLSLPPFFTSSFSRRLTTLDRSVSEGVKKKRTDLFFFLLLLLLSSRGACVCACVCVRVAFV